MGCWKSNNVVICDKYADVIEKYIDLCEITLKEKFPKISGKQIAQTIKFVVGRIK